MPVLKRIFLIFGLICALLLPVCCSKAPEPNYNVVMIVSDACRKDILGYYGGSAKTPNIDWLAEHGILFERAYSTAPCTLPSSCAMFTGNYSRAYIAVSGEGENMRFIYHVNDDERLFGEVLTENGYDMKMDLENGLAGASNSLQGFQKIRHMNNMNEEEIEFVEKTTGLEHIGQDEDAHRSSRYDKLYGPLHYLLTVPDTQNFFMLKWFADPHAPYHPPQKFRDRIAFDTSVLPKEESHYSAMYQTYSTKGLSPEEIAYLKELYKAEVESVDERVGFIIKALEYRGLLKNTFIIFTADHGEMLGEHDRLLHTAAFYEPLVNIPLIIAGPEIPKGKRVKTAVSMVDLVSTLKDMLHFEYSSDTQGQSFLPLLSGGSYRARDIYLARIGNRIVDRNVNDDGLLMDEYKLITSSKNDQPFFRLYNLEKDPDELKDISRQNPEIVRRMHEKILQLRKDCDLRFRENFKKIDENADLDNISKKNLDLLKSLGYIR